MAKKFFVFLLVIASAAVAGLLIGSQYPAYGQVGRIGGSYQLRMAPDSNPDVQDIVYLATVNSDGGVIVTVPPLACLPPDASFSTGHGTWGIAATGGGPRIQFHMLSALYIGGQFEGFMRILGETPLHMGDNARGKGHISFPDSLPLCERDFGGPSQFMAQAIPAVPPAR